MARMEAELDIDDGRAVLKLGGTLDVSNSHRLGSLLRRLVHEGCTDIVVDLSGTSTVDVSGIGILRGADRSLRRRCGGRLEFRGATPALAGLLAESGLCAADASVGPSMSSRRDARHPSSGRTPVRPSRPRVREA